ncbi:TPA: serine--tRNA ligase [archaeon]|nr:serine--tRNA ligase [Candidatus Naiadarchaeales archaeon SRR2090159.bin1288]
MIDINLLRTKPEIVKKSQKKRGLEAHVVDKVLDFDKKWRDLKGELDLLRAERNKLGTEIGNLKKSQANPSGLLPANQRFAVGKSADSLIKKTAELSQSIKDKDAELIELAKKRDLTLLDIPNILHDSVPEGVNEEDNKTVRTVGKVPKFKFKPKDHIDLGNALDLFDIDRAAKTSGARFYFLKNEAALLELALAQYAMDFLVKKKFTPLIVPNLVNEQTMYGVGMLPHAKSEIFKIEGDDKYLILTSEHAIGGLHMNETLKEEQLPLRYAGFSPCYRTEAGAHGRDTKGIFRVHQFNKVEMFVFSEPKDSWKEHEMLLKNAEELVKGLKLPYRVVNVCTGDIGRVAAKKYDIEAWFPGQNAYRELISCSNCTDFQARRLNTRVYRSGANQKEEVLHTLNSTALALGRTLVAILENNQNKDGSITIPKVLQKYTGFKKIESKK